MNADEFALHGAVWLSMVAWAAASVLPARWHRPLWTLGATSLAAHSILAMQLRHHWSHAAAVADTARQTQATFGLNWGGGVWFNYAMVALWLTDAAWSWLSPNRWKAAKDWQRLLRGYFFFMWFNGAVVFPSGPVRWCGLIACLLVIWSWWRGRSFRESVLFSGS